MQDDQQLEFHYYLADGLHSIDAVRLNKLEAEALDVFLYIANRLGYDVTLEATTPTEGGYRQVWKFVRNPKNIAVTTVLASTLVGGAGVAASVLNALIAAAAQIWVAPPKADPELDRLQRELLKRSIEEKELDLARKRRENESAKQNTEPEPGAPSPAEADPSNDAKGHPLQLDVRVVARRSNYYKLMLGDSRIVGLGLSWREGISSEPKEQAYIPRKQFVSYIVPSEAAEQEVVPNAFVEIVAPVIMSTKAKWRGDYLGKSISFAMRDPEFKSSILRKGIQFQSGDAIDCILRISYKINEVGENVISGYEVLGVNKLLNSAEGNTGARRINLKYQSKVPQRQLLLNFSPDEDETE